MGATFYQSDLAKLFASDVNAGERESSGLNGEGIVVSIVDVAMRAGVSPTSVSHALSGHRKVSDAVLSKVLDAVETLNYTPTRFAQSLAMGKTQIIGLIVPDISNPFFAELAEGVEKAAVEGGYNVLLSTTGFNHAREANALEMIRSKAVDGIIYAAGAPPSSSELKRLSADIPIVLVDEELPDLHIPSFVSDNFNGGHLAASLLADLGHRRAIVLDAGEDLVSSEHRVRGFAERWSEVEGGRVVRANGHFTTDGGRSAIQPFLQAVRNREFTSIFAANDLMALGALEVLLDEGFEVPADISVVGFDDSSQGLFSRPRLTTIRQDVVGMGEAAVHHLVQLLDSSKEVTVGAPGSSRRILPVSLIVRDTTGPLSAVAVRNED